MRHFILVSLLLWGCTPAPFPEAQRIEGATTLEFICLDEDSGELMGPLDGCGCHAWDAEAEGFVRLGRIECLCEDNVGNAVSHVETTGCGDESCVVRDDNGHLVPAASVESGVPCIPKTKGKVAAIVAGR